MVCKCANFNYRNALLYSPTTCVKHTHTHTNIDSIKPTQIDQQPQSKYYYYYYETANEVTQDKRERYKFQKTATTHFERRKDKQERKYVVKSEKKRETSNMNTNVAHVTFLDEANTGGGQAL